MMIDEMEEVLGNLLKENQPQDYIRIIEEENDKLYEQIEQLTNNWNELEKWVKEMSMGTCEYNIYDEIRDKMEEIKESKNEKN